MRNVIPGPFRDGVEFPNRCVHELFEQQAAATPSAIALRYGDQTLTYRAVDEQANQLAQALRRRGIGLESLVGVCLTRTPAMVIALLGIWKAGAAYVPLDPEYPDTRLAFMVNDASLSFLLVDQHTQGRFPPEAEPSRRQRLNLDEDASLIAQESPAQARQSSLSSPINLAYVMYTSGSTGQPKGAMINHGGLVNYLYWAIAAYDLRPWDSVPVHSSLAFDLTVTSLYAPLLVGGEVELLPEEAGGQALLSALRRAPGRGLVKITPAHLDLLTHQLAPEELAGLVRVMVIGGDALLAETLQAWRRWAPETRLINEYGPTETVVGCCTWEVRPTDPDSGPVPIGRPIANTRLYVLDEQLQPVRTGLTGELYIAGVGVARGYLNRPQLTAERFLPDPFAGEGEALMYKSGDLVRQAPDGVLEYLGRQDRQVKVRGYRIELGEIEAALATYPAVAACVVIARNDDAENRELVAYVAPRGEASAAALRRHLSSRLPDYMVPAHYVFLPTLPLTVNGKVDHSALPPPLASHAPTTYVAPRTAVEGQLAEIWGSVLKVERIGLHDDVFDLGAHSLQAVRAVARIRASFDIDLQLRHLFEQPTVAGLAGVVDGLTWLERHERDRGGDREEVEL